MKDIDEIDRQEKLQNVIRPRLAEGVLVSIRGRGVSEIGSVRGLFLLNSASMFSHLDIQRGRQSSCQSLSSSGYEDHL